jgi:hypothetical protein
MSLNGILEVVKDSAQTAQRQLSRPNAPQEILAPLLATVVFAL